MPEKVKSVFNGSISAAVLFIGLSVFSAPTPAQERPLNDTSVWLQSPGAGEKLIPDSVLAKVKTISAGAAFSDLAAVAGDTMEGRGIGTRGFERATRWVETRLKKIGVLPIYAQSYRQYFSVPKKIVERRTHFANDAPDTLTTWNVIGLIPGTDSLLKDEIIVLTAHLDHIGRTEDSIYYGANDNASGIAAMLNAAAFIAQNPLKRSLVLIAFSGEESGLLGSRFYTENPVFDMDQTVLLINLDIVGSGSEGIMLQGGEHYSYQQTLIEKINRLHFKFRIATRPNSPNSDHYFFNISGVPAFFIYAFPGSCPYHSPGDCPDCIDPSVLKNVTLFVSAVIWVFGND